MEHGAASATTTAPVAAVTIPACPDKRVRDGTWDSRGPGYASNHDVREVDWNGDGPVPVSLTQKCWHVMGTFRNGDCPGTLTGKIEKTILSGTYTSDCTTATDSSAGTLPVTMAADNRSFMGSMISSKSSYGPEAGFPPCWWAKKTV